jgi:hypothetical protein
MHARRRQPGFKPSQCQGIHIPSRCPQVVMELKRTISGLKQENAALSNAFVCLCSGASDWHSVLRGLPHRVSRLLPPSPPPLLVPPRTSHSLDDRIGTSLPHPTATAEPPRPRTAGGIEVIGGPVRPPTPEHAPSRRSRSHLRSTAPGQTALLSYGTMHLAASRLPCLPELAAMEEEFKALVQPGNSSRCGTAAPRRGPELARLARPPALWETST